MALTTVMFGLPFTPVDAGPPRVGVNEFDSVPSPEPMDPGSSSYDIVEPPAYVPHEVRTPDVVTAALTAGTDRAVAVVGLPVTIKAVPAAVADATVAPAVPLDGGVPVDTAPVEPVAKPTDVVVESLDAATVAAMGGEILVFGVNPADGISTATVEVAVDYSAFRYALGADWSNRLQLVQWACDPAMARAAAKECGNPVPVANVTNDLEAGVLTATVTIGVTRPAGATGESPLMFTGNGSSLGLASAAGSFQATSLSNSGSWQVGGNNGSFSYSYPITLPPAFNGLGPSVALSYDSSGVDGITSSVNAQASEVGLGWNLSAGQGFIERRYLPCTDSRIGGGTTDSCWYVQNATISLNGHAGELVPVNGTTGVSNSFTLWRLKDDPDWLVQRVPSASGNWWTDEYWKVTTPEGMVYTFGREDELQNSRLVRPLRGITGSDDPCWSLTNKLCTDMPYRWMLDKVEDPYGNVMVYKYDVTVNRARTMGSGYSAVNYDLNAVLAEIQWGKSPNAGINGYRGKVAFTYVRRCVEALSSSFDPSCPTIDNAHGTSYPDVPTDLYCPAGDCFKDVSFFNTKRLALISTYTSTDGSGWSPVGQWRTWGLLPDPGDGGNEKLWLSSIYRVQWQDPALFLPPAVTPPSSPVALLPGTAFGGVPLQNRRDGNPAGGVPYMNQFRLSELTDDLGQKIEISYTSPTCSLSNPDWSTNTTNCFPMYASFTGGGAGWGVYRRWTVSQVVVRDLVTGAVGQTGTAVTPAQTYTYTYTGAAWHHDPDEWWVDTPGVDDVSWGEWRGYQTVKTVSGTTGNTLTVSKQVFYQGMHGDKAASGTKTVTMTRGTLGASAWVPPTGEGFTNTIYDQDWLQGQLFESYQMDGDTTNFLSGSRNYSTWTQVSTDGVAPKTGLPQRQTRKWRMTLANSISRDGTLASPTWRYQRTDTSIDTLGRMIAVNNTGFTDWAGDESCTRTWYIAAASTPTTTSPGWMNLVAQQASWNSLGTQPTHEPSYVSSGCGGTQPIGVSKQFYNSNSYSSGSGPTALALDAMAQTLGAGFKPLVTTAMTRTKNADGATDLLNRWLYTRTTYDTAGRVTATYDAVESAKATPTASVVFGFDATYGYPASATYPLSLGSVTTSLRPGDGQPNWTRDQNLRQSNFCYDSLSRVTAAFQPRLNGTDRVAPCGKLITNPLDSDEVPAAMFTYDIGAYDGTREHKTPTIVISSVLQDGTTLANDVRVETAAYIDGFGRTRETQAWSPTAGQIIASGALVDERGNTVTGIEAFAIADAAPGDRSSPSVNQANGFTTWPNLPTGVTLRTDNAVFDTANRATSSTRKWGINTLVTTATEYLGTSTITKPQIGSWQKTTVDGLGRVSRIETYNGSTPANAQGSGGTSPDGSSVTTFGFGYSDTANVAGGYDMAGWLTTVAYDDAIITTVTLTDLAGRTIVSIDPNAGYSSLVYDANGNITQTADAAGNVVHTEYDILGRPIGRWSGGAGSFAAAAGTDKLASWTYDTVTGGKGLVATETSWQAGVQYTSTVQQYSPRYLPLGTKVNVPGTYGTDLLAGDWKFTTSYNEAGQPITVSRPKTPVNPANPNDLPAWDQTTTHYDGFAQPDKAWAGVTQPVGTNPGYYVTGTGLDQYGRVTSRTLSDTTASNVSAMQREYGYDTSTGALSTFKAGWLLNGSTSWFQNDAYTRDAIGNVTQIVDNGKEPGWTPSDVKECFLYDQWNRLIRAHSAALGAACATNTTSATVATGSRDPYDQVWTFDDINRMTSRVNKMTASTTTYNYNAPGHTHAVSSTTGGVAGSYTYNAIGAMATRNGTTLVYDTQQRLKTYGATESYVYSTSNQRLIRQAGVTRTLYLPGMEVAATGATRTISTYITIGTTQVAIATSVGGGTASITWWCGSMQNSNTCQAPKNSAPAAPARKRYTPYGDDRNTVTFTNTDHGYLGQPEDTTGLTYLNNRYYDPAVGVFVTVDPLVGRTGQPYLYSSGNPTTLSDPSGLAAIGAGGCVDGACYGPAGAPKATGKVNLEDPDPVDAHNGSTTEDLSSLPLFGPNGPRLSDVQQGQVGDCWFMAALGSIALTSPDWIKNMITDNGNGTFTVHFSGAGIMGDVTVDADFYVDSNGQELYAKANGCLWPLVMEKAVAQLRGGDYDLISGGSAEFAFEYMGLPFDSTALNPAFWWDPSDGDLVNLIRNNPTRGIVARSDGQFGLGGSHVWVVNGVYADENGDWMVVVTNPWGIPGEGAVGTVKNDSRVNYSDRGAWSMPISVFSANFDHVIVA
ncbi:MAG: C2 family cysteine protease [Actinomycetota bacterium]|nr:C2 family cysteine protease [Actinomycetota bacterium]